MAKVCVAVVTYARDEQCLHVLLAHLANQDYHDWSLHVVDTTAAALGQPAYAPRFLAAARSALPNREIIVREYVQKAELESTWERVANARNMLREEFLASDAEYLLFLDSDVMLPRDGISTLLSHNAPAVSGVYINVLTFKGTSLGRDVTKISPVAWIKDRNEPERLSRPLLLLDVIPPRVMPFYYGGFGCLLLRREVLEAVPIEVAPQYPGTEDIPFYLELDRRGIQALLDTRVKCAHMHYPPGDERNAVADFANYRVQITRKPAA